MRARPALALVLAGLVTGACSSPRKASVDAGPTPAAPSALTADPAGDTARAGTCDNAPGQLFPPGSPWNTPVDQAPLDAESSAIIAYLERTHTARARFQIDASIKVLVADASTPRRTFAQTEDFFSPDCDPAPIPLPAGGALEAETGYACAGDGDCHLLVIDTARCRLHEMWRADVSPERFAGGCQAVWDLRRTYAPPLRGEGCTSADAAGLPIAAHLFSADEIAAGKIDHAIRFVLPNELIRDDTYVHPATHGTRPTSGPPDAPPYGARLRLRASTDLRRLNPAAQVVARALQRHGMILSDGGVITFTSMADDFTRAKWASVGLGSHDLKALRWSDFEVVEGGQRFRVDAPCVRTPVTD